MKRIMIFLFVFFLNIYLAGEENLKAILVLKNGSEYKGYLKKITDREIFFEINGQEKKYLKIDVNRLQFSKNRLFEDVDNVSKINDKDIIDIVEAGKKWQMNKNYQAVILLDKAEYTYVNEKKSFVTMKKAIKVLNQEGKNYSTQFFSYFKSSKANLLYAISIAPDGKVSAIEESAINDESLNSDYPQYDALKRIKFGMKDVDVGSILIWEARVDSESAKKELSFFKEKDLISDEPVEKEIITVKFPLHMKVNRNFFKGLVKTEIPEIKESVENNFNVLTVELNNIKPFINDEANIPSRFLIIPKFYAGFPDTWENIGNNFYNDFFKKPVTKELEDYTKNLVKEDKDDLSRIKRIYDFINRKIVKAKVPMSEYYFVPHPDNELIKLSSLNVLDKTFLFVRMSKALNINADFYFFRLNSKNGLIHELPSLKQFNSVISKIEIDKKNYFVNFDNEQYGFNQPPFTSGNAPALLINEKSKIENLPEIKSSSNSYAYEYNCILNIDGSLDVTKITKVSGEFQTVWRDKRFLTKNDLDTFMKNRASSFGSNAVLTGYRFINKLDDFDLPVVFEEKITIKDFSFSSGDKIKLFKIPEVRFKSGSVSKPKRVLPFDNRIVSETYYNINIQLPAGYKVKYLPKSADNKTDTFQFSAGFSEKNNNINMSFSERCFRSMVPAEEYLKYKSTVEEFSKLTNEWIVLEAAK